jgi:ribose 5-phosphate isomerase B
MTSPFNLSKPIAIGSDHAGYDYKERIISYLEGKGLAFTDFGTHSADSVDYPDFAHPVATAVEKAEAAFGILICGSANGVAITAHNNANIICLPARFVREGDAEKMVQLFMTTTFEAGRHKNRVDKIACV